VIGTTETTGLRDYKTTAGGRRRSRRLGGRIRSRHRTFAQGLGVTRRRGKRSMSIDHEYDVAMNQRIHGVLAPVVTPFKDDLSPDRERLIAQCKWLVSQNCGLAVFGTNSEGNSLSVDERSDLLDALFAAGVDPSRMMPGTGCCSITDTVKLTAQAVKHGCAGVLMLPPFYYKGVSEEGLYRYFSEVVQRVGDARLRIYLYHIPPVAMVGITTGLVERLLAAYPDVIAGMKDSSGDWNNTKTFLDAFGPSRTGGTGFDVFVGSESFLLANMRNGGVGTISAMANVNPAAIYKLYAACSKPRKDTNPHESPAGDSDGEDDPPTREATARQAQQAELDVVRKTFAKYPMVAALKQGIAIYANDPAWAKVRPPLVELTAEQTKRLAAELKAIDFAMPGLWVPTC
jgi:4-hydroxy-tetrahydrodipicolinate synthase